MVASIVARGIAPSEAWRMTLVDYWELLAVLDGRSTKPRSRVDHDMAADFIQYLREMGVEP